MKKLLFILLSAGVNLSACSPAQEPTKEEVLQVLNKELGYPRVVDYEIFCSDPEHARKLVDAGLETNGLVLIQKTQKLKDAGTALVQFTEKANPYLLPTPEKDKTLDIQKVKIADEEVSEISISRDGENSNVIWVEYSTVYKNITPFSVLLKKNLEEPVKRKVKLSLSENGWVLQK
jgi:hypothetical protein